MKGFALCLAISFMSCVPSAVEGAILEPQSRRLDAKEGDKMELICVRRSSLHKPFVWSRRLANHSDFVVIETTTGNSTKSKAHLEQQHWKSQRQHKHRQHQQGKHQLVQNSTTDSEPTQQQMRHQQRPRKHKTTTATSLLPPPQKNHSKLRRAITSEKSGEVQGTTNQENPKRNKLHDKQTKQQQDKRQHKTKTAATTNKTHNSQQHPPTKQHRSNNTKISTKDANRSDDNHTTSSDRQDGFYVFITTDASTKLSYLRKNHLELIDSGEYRCMGEGLPSDVVVVSVSRNVPLEYKNATIDKTCTEYNRPICRRLSSSSSKPSSSSSSSSTNSDIWMTASPVSSSSSSPEGWEHSLVTPSTSFSPSSTSSSSSSSVRWSRFNDSSVIQFGETLELKRPTLENAGLYSCHISDQSGEEHMVLVHYFAPPTAKIQQTKTNKMVEGHDLTLRCHVWGWPLPEITWWKDGMKLDVTEIRKSKMADNSTGSGSTHDDWKVREYNAIANNNNNNTVTFNISLDNKTSQSRDLRLSLWREDLLATKLPTTRNSPGFVSVLGISRVKFSDRAKYSCVATNNIPLPCYNGSQLISNSTVMVRISGKLDFLWPLLGIIAEFIILFIIILIYENNKKKKKREDADDDDDEESGSSRAKLHNRRNKTGKSIESNRDQQMPMNRLRKP